MILRKALHNTSLKNFDNCYASAYGEGEAGAFTTTAENSRARSKI